MPQYWCAHSWGGVLMLAYLARPTVPVQVRAMAFFGNKRRISIWSLKRLLMIDVVWKWFSTAVIAAIGWLPAKKLRIGSDSETRLTHKQTLEWVVRKKWLHWKDGFDYAAALQQMHLPPTLYLTGMNDDVLGHPTDVEKLNQETGSKNSAFHVVSKANANLHDYDHISLLTHADAPKDHFLQVVQWFRQAEKHLHTKPAMNTLGN